jgi:hypothetical protein
MRGISPWASLELPLDDWSLFYYQANGLQESGQLYFKNVTNWKIVLISSSIYFLSIHSLNINKTKWLKREFKQETPR